jgi:hypothetical protein
VPRRERTAPASRIRSKPAGDADAMRDAELENSILSAIADAVDVLAVDRPGQPAKREPVARRANESTAPLRREVRPPPLDQSKEEEDDPVADEIGDEIQRILASYTANR